ncbi:hypothetical protein EVAR_26700_1 [Eumeta japonica]|uniref:Uncharacterized protein n=1 Tax=Eumeta variegata TaxID=151549 RepID=A0A4C1ZS01_EUMVA|nr:hypothetical protein EVAR_26700_1 [Eumeta japonica]
MARSCTHGVATLQHKYITGARFAPHKLFKILHSINKLAFARTLFTSGRHVNMCRAGRVGRRRGKGRVWVRAGGAGGAGNEPRPVRQAPAAADGRPPARRNIARAGGENIKIVNFRGRYKQLGLCLAKHVKLLAPEVVAELAAPTRISTAKSLKLQVFQYAKHEKNSLFMFYILKVQFIQYTGTSPRCARVRVAVYVVQPPRRRHRPAGPASVGIRRHRLIACEQCAGDASNALSEKYDKLNTGTLLERLDGRERGRAEQISGERFF